jgi:hypothetical protein
MMNDIHHLLDELHCIEAQMALVEALLRQHLTKATNQGDHPTVERIQALLTAA